MSAPTVTYSGNFIKISWSEPSNNGSPILKYLVEILKSDLSTFSQDLINCDGSKSTIKTNKYCEIPLTTLRSAPFSLTYGTLV